MQSCELNGMNCHFAVLKEKKNYDYDYYDTMRYES